MFLFVVTRLWKMNSFLVIVYMLLAFFCDGTEFEHHISLNSESVHTPTVYNLKNMSCDVCVIESNARGVNSHLTWEMAF